MKKILLSLTAGLCLLATVYSQCNFTNGYAGPGGWTTNGSCYPTCYSIGPSSFNFNVTPGGGYDFATTTTPCTINNTCWCADIDFVYTGRSGPGVAHTLLSFTSNASNSWNTGPAFAVSNNDVIEAYLISPLNGPPGSETIVGRSKFGNTWNTASTGIPVTTGNTYYIRLQRLTPTQGLISVFSNPARTIPVAGSPQCFPINAGVAGLATLQHGAIPQAGPGRTMTGTLSNLVVNDVVPGITGMPSLICGKILGAYNLNVGPVCGASNYAWSGPSGFTITSGQGTSGITASISAGVSGTVTCVISFPGAACSITYTMTILHSPLPTLSVSASPSSTICFGSSTTLTASGTATSYSWSPTTGLSNPTSATTVANPTVTTTYTVTGTNAAGCSRTATITVTVNPLLTANAGPNDTTCCGSITYLGTASGSASGGTLPYSYSWSPTTNFIGCTNCAQPTVMDCSGSGPVTYTLTVTDALGCTATSTVTIWFNVGPCRLANPNPDPDQQNAPATTNEMLVAPNPTSGSFVITLPGESLRDVEVINVLGKIVYSKSGIEDAYLTVDLSDQPKGVYFVRCREGDETFVQQIIVQ